MESTINHVPLESNSARNSEEDIVPLPRLRAMANTAADHSFFEPRGIPQSSLDHYSDIGAALFSLPYLYSLSWGHKMTRFFYVMDFPKAGMQAPVIGQMYWLGSKDHEDKSENVELLRREMVSGLLDCDDAQYDTILTALKAGVYIRATVHSMKMMHSGSTGSRVIMGNVYCEIVDSDSDSEIESHLTCRRD